ncbi:UDP-glucose dehydrogenase family protein [Aneurinibacillus aneurinilyticus]|uniref:UDP-glucose dehydrogenase family protein n=1 Tax=Aneurinibacillus aneurinilyticus TaxID=1391 RepID=UPI0035233819
MKKVAVIGAGYAGLAVSIGLAHCNIKVRCIDIDERKIGQLSQGSVPIHEPEMEEMLRRQLAARRLTFSTDMIAGIKEADVIFIAVGTPGQEKGAPDVTAIFSVVDTIAQHVRKDVVIAIKSTVPPGTCEAVQARLREQVSSRFVCDVVANPEFLREGQALRDFLEPERIVLGGADERAITVMQELYASFSAAGVPFYTTDWRTSEMIKYSANSFLAMKVTFINEIARLCDAVGADVKVLTKALGADPRIGNQHLSPGPGYGGSCLPKDTEALALFARQAGAPLAIIEAVIESNRLQQKYVVEKMKREWSSMQGLCITVYGLAFKANTDDMRESPAIPVIDQLLAEGVQVCVYDPQAMNKACEIWGERVRYGMDAYDAAVGAHALVILTDWQEFTELHVDRLERIMAEKVIFDFRNACEAGIWRRHGFRYIGIGV